MSCWLVGNNRWSAAAMMVAASALAIAGFTALGTSFDYPGILHSPTTENSRKLSGTPSRDQRLVPLARYGRGIAGRDFPPTWS